MKFSSVPEARRFIPACAGNSSSMPVTSVLSPVHPRVCGEQFDFDAKIRRGPGSSPRVRGTESEYLNRSAKDRFIPACAGNSP